MAKGKAGRPSDYDAKKAAQICEALATSSRGLGAVCEELGIASRSTVYRWLTENEEFRERYTQAREFQCQVLADELLEIADKPQVGTVTKIGPNGTETRTGDMIDHRRLQVDARKWVLAKLLPAKYGDRTEVTGANGGAILITSIERPNRGNTGGPKQ